MTQLETVDHSDTTTEQLMTCYEQFMQMQRKKKRQIWGIVIVAMIGLVILGPVFADIRYPEDISIVIATLILVVVLTWGMSFLLPLHWKYEVVTISGVLELKKVNNSLSLVTLAGVPFVTEQSYDLEQQIQSGYLQCDTNYQLLAIQFTLPSLYHLNPIYKRGALLVNPEAWVKSR